MSNPTHIAHSGAPHVLEIRANHLDGWADTLESRNLLPELVRRLILETNNSLLECDFPSADSGERKGWDGTLVSKTSSLNVPERKSCWEFGTSKDITKKANGDYTARCTSVANDEKGVCTFVFVSPRRWANKNDWLNEKRNDDIWQGVLALDADNLQDWLSQAPATALWLKEQLDLPVKGLRTLDRYWKTWSGGCDPVLSPTLFESQSKEILTRVEQFLAKGGILKVAARGAEEAIAFLSVVAASQEDSTELARRVVVIDSVDDCHKLKGFSSVIPIVKDRNIRKALDATSCDFDCQIEVVEYVNSNADFTLRLPTWEDFDKAAKDMCLDDAEASRLRHVSHKSPTVIHRHYQKSEHLRTPDWSLDDKHKEVVIASMLAGVANLRNENDVEILNLIAGREIGINEFSDIAALEDSPLWTESHYVGVVSKLEVLQTLSPQVSKRALEDFIDTAVDIILREKDPALTLKRSERWLAHTHDKTRSYSSEIRTGILDTLVMLSVHSPAMWKERLGIDLKFRIRETVLALLTSDHCNPWLELREDLPQLAEAAPDEFLESLNTELSSGGIHLTELFAPVDKGSLMNHGCYPAGLLWALETLAWSPCHVGLVSDALARLESFDCDDGYSNSPSRSLQSIFHPGWPQTSIEAEIRNSSFERLFTKHPKVCWAIAVNYCSNNMGFISSSSQPKWNGWATDKKVNFQSDAWSFLCLCHKLLLDKEAHTAEEMFDLLQVAISGQGRHLDRDAEKFMVTMRRWEQSASCEDRKWLRSKSIRYLRYGKGAAKDNANYRLVFPIFEMLTPRDASKADYWLFEKSDLQYFPMDMEEQYLDYSSGAEVLQTRRLAVLDRIFKQHGNKGGIALISECPDGAFNIGHTLSTTTLKDTEQKSTFLILLLPLVKDEKCLFFDCLSGFVRGLNVEEREAIIPGLLLDERWEYFLLQTLPFLPDSWGIVEPNHSEKYWAQTTIPLFFKDIPEIDCQHAIQKLIKADRPIAALSAARYRLELLQTDILCQLLCAATQSTENDIRLDHHDFISIFEELRSRNDLNDVDVFLLEMLYCDLYNILDNTEAPLHTNKVIEKSPKLFIYMCALTYLKDEYIGSYNQKMDLKVPTDDAVREFWAGKSYHLINLIRLSPKLCEGVDTLHAWVNEVQLIAAEFDMVDIVDYVLATLFAKTDMKADVWPPVVVAEVMETIWNDVIHRNFIASTNNQRGMHSEPWDGKGEKVLADAFRRRADKHRIDRPKVAKTIDGVADGYISESGYKHSTGLAEMWKR